MSANKLDSGQSELNDFKDLSFEEWRYSEEVNKEINAKAKENDSMENDFEYSEKGTVSKAVHLKWTKHILQALKDLGGTAKPKEVRDKIAKNENLTEDELNERTADKKGNKFETDVAFAKTNLVFAGYLDNSNRGVWSLTEEGKNVEMTEELASDIFKKRMLSVAASKKSKENNENSDNNEEENTKDKETIKVSKASHLKWMKPLLQALKDLGGSAKVQEVRNKIIENEYLTENQSEEKEKTNYDKFKNNVSGAKNCLVYAGYIDNSIYGTWTLTEEGKNVVMTDELASEILKKYNTNQANKDDEGVLYVKFEDTELVYPLYNEQNFLEEVFMSEEGYKTLVQLVKAKKNVILQGAPGVGKTYIAKRLAYSMMGVKDKNRVMLVQFHQSYSYEDLIEGYRPTENGFEIKKGSLYNFCKKATDDLENDYFFIIDEINRGNVSKIFGELFMLIENDKRGNTLQLLFSEEKFFVPKNVYIIGMMNTADRSLAMIDYALRRRFAFYDIKPAFSACGFVKYKASKQNSKLDELIRHIESLNEAIANDDSLGDGFCIGHSYFCNLGDLDNDDDKSLYNIVEYELIPLLKEYWFDEPSKVRDWSSTLRGAIK